MRGGNQTRVGRMPVLRRHVSHKVPETLHEEDAFEIYRWADGHVSLNLGGERWSERIERLCRRFGVTSLTFNNLSVRKGSIGFIRSVPTLRKLSISTIDPIDLSPIEGMANLELLWLRWDVDRWDAHATPPPALDFTTLPNLKRCRIRLHPPFESLLACEWLTELEVYDTAGRAHLDLNRLKRLGKLTLENCLGMRSFTLSERARLRELEITSCLTLKVDWQRVGRDLEDLSINGRVGFPLDEIAAARKLKRLGLFKRNLPSLKFVKRLPRLWTLNWLPTAPEDRLSEENWKLITSINTKRRSG